MIYLAFGYDQYYPLGGFNDFLVAAKTVNQLKLLLAENCISYENLQVIELNEDNLVWEPITLP